jgi:hypothetical protein
MRSRGLSLQCPKTEVRRLLRPSGAPMPQTPICAIGETDDFIYNLLLIFIIDVLVEANGIEPMTSGLQSRRSPS